MGESPRALTLTFFSTGFDFDGISPDPEQMAKMYTNSPISHIANIKVPVHLNLGTLDKRVPMTQGLELYKSLKALGKEVTANVYDDCHPLAKPSSHANIIINSALFFNVALKRSRIEMASNCSVWTQCEVRLRFAKRVFFYRSGYCLLSHFPPNLFQNGPWIFLLYTHWSQKSKFPPNRSQMRSKMGPGHNLCVCWPIFKILFSTENCVYVECMEIISFARGLF